MPSLPEPKLIVHQKRSCKVGYQGMREGPEQVEGKAQIAYLPKNVKRPEPISRPAPNIVDQARRDSITNNKGH